MAKAPTAARARKARASGDGDGATELNITWRGRQLSFSTGDLGPGDDLACRMATGWAFTGFVSMLQTQEKVGTDIAAAVLWMARRKNGEPGLTWDAHLETIGSNDEMLRDLQIGEPAIDATTEGSGAAGPLDVAEATPVP